MKSGDAALITLVAGRNGGRALMLAIAILCLPPGGMPSANAQLHAYIPNACADTVSVIDVDTETVIDTITTAPGAGAVEWHPDGTRVYIANNGLNDGDGNTISVIDTRTRTVIDTIQVGDGPEGMAMHPDGTFLYVAVAGVHQLPPDQINDFLKVIDTSSNEVVATVEVGDHPWDVAISPDGSTIYVANAHSESVTMIDAVTLEVLDTVLIGDGNDVLEDYHTSNLYIGPQGDTIWVVSMHQDRIDIFDLSMSEVIACINVRTDSCKDQPTGFCEHPMAVAFLPERDLAFVGFVFQHQIGVFDTTTYTEISRFEAGSRPKGIGLTPDGLHLWVANQIQNGTVTIFNTFTFEVENVVSVGAWPLPFGTFFGEVAEDDPPEDQDADNDGVMDDVDACPDTPAGELPDATGCSCSQLDDDLDTVSNCDDQCPDTPASELADVAGCSCSQLDDDLDAVSNCDDQCPDTPLSELGDATGCSCSQLDDDFDGVSNCDDQCPDTPAGEVVGEVGCSDTEIDDDQDEDGVPNGEDQCPDTPIDEPVDAQGCGQSQLDDDADGVSNVDDLCPSTPVGETVNGQGCGESELDSDDDGVSDADDLCPDTFPPIDCGLLRCVSSTGIVLGLRHDDNEEEYVDEFGCADYQLDTDGDGLFNDGDWCIDTPTNEVDEIDIVGCGPSERDGDGDGVVDAIDECPDTDSQEATDSINDVGCAPYQLDDDEDGITNDLDQCPNTATGQPVDQKGCALADTEDDPEEDIVEVDGQVVDPADEAGDGDGEGTSSEGGGLCGMLGMLHLAGIFSGLTMLRLSHRCRRGVA